MFLCLFACVFACLSVCLSVCLLVCLFVCLCEHVCVFVTYISLGSFVLRSCGLSFCANLFGPLLCLVLSRFVHVFVRV